ncbi:PDZ domain-containing protein [Tenacibaculum sp. 190130A14a]|uniref:PDZ domain-containing protein n=1 Tax=Tenacibaculum polynesiense TaxID=3137857 RepID=A0ABM9PF79_9FLAO
MRKKLLTLLLLHVCLLSFGQGKFQFFGKKTDKQTVSFRLINNLIVIPLEINDKPLSFILDTGVNKTILFNLTQNDSIDLKEVRKVFIHGLGDGEPVEALLSRKNTFRVNNIVNSNESLYVILKDAFNLSARMGTTIHGIIGYDLLKDVIARVDYNNKKVTFYNPKTFKYPKRCRKCETIPLEFYRNKPYVDVNVDLVDNVNDLPVKLLIDSGGTDAMWLFEDTKKEIRTPKKYFNDVLGEGFSGTIYGNRSRVAKLKIGKYEIIQPTAAFLDSTSTFNARKFKKRNGSIGGEVLKRFKVWIDYPNGKITFKKNAPLKGGFYYNMSGLHVIYNGQELIKEEAITKFARTLENNNVSKNNTISLVTTFFYRFKPSYKIDKVVEGSPAARAGLMEGDVIKYINGKPAHTYTMGQIMELFHSKPDKKIKLKVDRGVTRLKYEFRLEQRI